MPSPGRCFAIRDGTRPRRDPCRFSASTDAPAAAWHLVGLRLRRATAWWRRAGRRRAGGGAAAGAAGGCIGGLLLVAAPGHSSPLAVVPVLAAIGTICGGVAGAGIGAGLAVAESVLRSWRTAGTIAGGAIGGGLVGLGIQLLGGWTLEILEGVSPPVGGGFEGLVIGASAAFGYALATRSSIGGVPAPRGRARWRVALFTAVSCACGALAVSLTGRPLVGGTLHAIAHSSVDGPGLLGPLGTADRRARLRAGDRGADRARRGAHIRPWTGAGSHATTVIGRQTRRKSSISQTSHLLLTSR